MSKELKDSATTKLSHRDLVWHMNNIGYSEIDEQGAGLGVSSMGLLSILVKEIKVFNNRIEEIIKEIELEREDKVWSEEEAKRLISDMKNNGVFSFYDGIELFQQGFSHPTLGGSIKGDLIDARLYVAEIINSIAMEKKKGLYLVDNSVGVYNEEELTQLFETLKEVVTANTSESVEGVFKSSSCNFSQHISSHSQVN